MNQEDKIWFTIENTTLYGSLKGVIKVTGSNVVEYVDEVIDSINAFHNEIEWEGMWDLQEAKSRLQNNEVLFLLRDADGALGHVWFQENYLYNLFVCNRRELNTSIRFIEHCLSNTEYDKIKLYCDAWNIRAQKFFFKLGAKKVGN